MSGTPFNSATWSYKAAITVDHTKVNADATDFPIYLNLANLGSGHGFWTHVLSTGADIRILKSDLTTEVPLEVVAIDTTAKTGEVHFKAAGTLSASSDTTFYLAYGNASAVAYDVTETYGRNNVWTAGFHIVAHFQEDPDTQSFVNSCGGPSGTYTNTSGLATLSSGKIGKGCDFTGGSVGHVAMSTITDSDRNYAFSAFAKFNSTGVQAFFEYSTTGSTLGGRRVAAMYNAGKVNWNHNNAQGYNEPTTTINTGTWYHMSVNSVQTDSTHSDVNVWVDGTNKTTKSAYLAIDTDGSNCKIGCNRSAGEEFDGYLDEVRYYNTNKADSWMVTESENLRNPSTFVAYGSEAAFDSTPPTLSSSSPSDGATGVSPTANIVLTFTETVQKGSSGNIIIKKYSDDSTFESIAITDAKITASGTDITINPAGTLADLTRYYITVDNTCIKDVAGNYYAGISSKDTLDFTTADSTAPTLSSSSPADGDSGIAVSANTVLTFSETVVKGSSGNVTIKKYSDDSTIEALAIADAKISIASNVVTINWTSDLALATRYYVLIDNTCFKDSSDNYYAGISSKDTLDFTTVDTIAPTLSSSSPADNATGVTASANIVLTFDENVVKGTGNISIKNYDTDADIEVIDVTSGLVSVSTNQVTINPTANLPNATHVYVLIDNTAIEDTSGNAYAGISSKTVLDFTIADTVAPILTSSIPEPDAIGIVPDTTITLTFDEDVFAGTGDITIYSYDDDVEFEAIDVTSGQVVITDNEAVITPSSDLGPNTKYYIFIDSTAFEDAASNAYAGIDDKDTLAFTTVPIAIEALTPAEGATGISPAANLELDFNQTVAANIGNITISQRPNLKIGSSDFSGDVGEILVVRDNITDDDRKKAEGYLAWRWFGATNPLPASHPYKYRSPTI